VRARRARAARAGRYRRPAVATSAQASTRTDAATSSIASGRLDQPADAQDRGVVLGSGRKADVRAPRPLQKEVDRAAFGADLTGRDWRGRGGVRDGQAGHFEHPLGLDVERLARGEQHLTAGAAWSSSASRSASDSPDASVSRCSALSSTIEQRFVLQVAAQLGAGSAGPEKLKPSASATAGATKPAELSGASSTNAAPPGKAEPSWFTAPTARRVLPIPPAPTRVSRRHSGSASSRLSSPSSRRRPTSGLA
jgi:hypothetical protein